jgi:hypothetical protein
LDARLTTLLCKIIVVAKSKEAKTGWSIAYQKQRSLAESCKKKRAIFSVMMMIMTMMVMMINKMIGYHDFCLLIFTIVIFGTVPA